MVSLIATAIAKPIDAAQYSLQTALAVAAAAFIHQQHNVTIECDLRHANARTVIAAHAAHGRPSPSPANRFPLIFDHEKEGTP